MRAIAGHVEGNPATGYSKKEAQQKASQQILKQLHQDKDFLRAILYQGTPQKAATDENGKET